LARAGWLCGLGSGTVETVEPVGEDRSRFVVEDEGRRGLTHYSSFRRGWRRAQGRKLQRYPGGQVVSASGMARPVPRHFDIHERTISRTDYRRDQRSSVLGHRQIEHVTFNHGVEGSSPSALTKQIVKSTLLQETAVWAPCWQIDCRYPRYVIEARS
jgi:hypothetical protein